MNKISPDFPFSRFVGTSINMICFTKNSLHLHFDESGIGPISTYPECVRVENNSAIVEINTKSLDLILESKIDNLFITDSSDLLFLISEELKIIIFNKNDNFESYSINIDGINYIV